MFQINGFLPETSGFQIMNSNRSLYLKRNTVWSLILQITTVVCGFILPKFILGAFGSEANGLINSVTNFLGFISLCELGVGAVIPANLYRPIAENDMDKISAVMASAQRFYRTVAFILAAYVLILIGFYPFLVSDKFSFLYTASIIIIIAASSFARYFFGIICNLLLKSYQKQYVSFALEVATIVANLLFSIILIKCGFDLIIVKLVSSLVFISRPLILTFYVKKHYKLNLKIKYDKEPIKQKWNGITHQIALVVQEKSGAVILTMFSTLSNVSVYAVYYMIVNGIKSVLSSLTIGVSSFLGDILAKDETENLKKSFSKFEWITHTVSTYLFSVAGILLVPFVKVYTKGLADSDIYITPLFSALICIAFAIGCIQLPYSTLTQVAGHFKQTQQSAVIESALNIVISVLAVLKFGLAGVAIGALISLLYKLLYLSTYLMKNIIFIKPINFAKQILVDIISAALMVLSATWLEMKAVSLRACIMLGLPVALICLIISLVINLIFYKEQLISILQPISNKFRREK